MRFLLLMCCVMLAVRGALAGQTMTLDAVLAGTYEGNPHLQAARAQLAAADEAVAEALGAERPTASALLSMGPFNESQTIYGAVLPRQVFGYHQQTAQVNLGVPLFHGGALQAGVEIAEAQVRAQREQLRGTEADTLLAAATAYCDVLLQRQLLDVARSYEADLGQIAQMLRTQFGTRDVTRTSLDQTLGRLATATAQRLQAEAAVRDAEARFHAVTGQDAGAHLSVPTMPAGLPTSADAARRAAAAAPAVAGSVANAAAADAAVLQARAAYLPSADLAGLVQYADEAAAATAVANNFSLGVNLSVPLYQGGQLASGVRAARESSHVAHLNIDSTTRAAVRDAGDAWAATLSIGDELAIRRRQVAQDRIAYAAMLHLSLNGERTMTDTLDTRQELQIVSAEAFQAAHDQIVDAYQVLQATGALSAAQLGLHVALFDPEAHYRKVRGAFLDPPFQR